MDKIKFPADLLRPLRNYLLGEKKKLVKVKKKRDKDDPYKNEWGGEDDPAIDTEVSEIINHDQVSAERKEASRAIISIRKALTKMKLGTYGICEGCGSMIDTDRLAINPTADLCVECEKKREKRK